MTIALEDPSFLEHEGYTIESLLNPSRPTITQKLISDLLLWNEPMDSQKTFVPASSLLKQQNDSVGKKY